MSKSKKNTSKKTSKKKTVRSSKTSSKIEKQVVFKNLEGADTIDKKIAVHESNMKALSDYHTSIVQTTMIDDKDSVVVAAMARSWLIEKKQLMIAVELNRLRVQKENEETKQSETKTESEEVKDADTSLEIDQ